MVDWVLDAARELGAEPLVVVVSPASERRVRAGVEVAVQERAARDRRRLGYGAPGKGNTLLNYAAIGTDFLDFTVDRNPYKHGRHTPGMHIPIYPVKAIDDARPDYILILPWNLKDEIVEQMRHVGEWGAKFVVPIPSVSIVDPNELFS